MPHTPLLQLTAFAALLLSVAAGPVRGADVASVNLVLDSFHQAAAEADFERYSDQMTDTVVFLGTDATERWQGEGFRSFVRGYFEQGRGWTYRPTRRAIDFSEDGRSAWFDELLQHERLGQCRGSGVLVLQQGRWKIAQYNLSVPIPNAMVEAVAADIRAGVDQGVPGVEAVSSQPGTGPESAVVGSSEEAAAEAGYKRPCRKHHKSSSRVNC